MKEVTPLFATDPHHSGLTSQTGSRCEIESAGPENRAVEQMLYQLSYSPKYRAGRNRTCDLFIRSEVRPTFAAGPTLDLWIVCSAGRGDIADVAQLVRMPVNPMSAGAQSANRHLPMASVDAGS